MPCAAGIRRFRCTHAGDDCRSRGEAACSARAVEEGTSHERANRRRNPQGGVGGGRRQRARMVRFRRLRLRRDDHRQEVLPGPGRGHGAALDLPRLRARLRRAPARRHRHRPPRRHPRPQDRAAHHHLPDGRRHGADRPLADLRDDRRPGAAAPRRRAADAGLLGRRRMGRLDRLHRRMGAGRKARLVRQLPADERRRRACCSARASRRCSTRSSTRRTMEDWGWRVPVPARRHPRPGRDVDAARRSTRRRPTGSVEAARRGRPDRGQRLAACGARLRLHHRLDGVLLRSAQLHADLDPAST